MTRIPLGAAPVSMRPGESLAIALLPYMKNVPTAKPCTLCACFVLAHPSKLLFCHQQDVYLLL